MPSSGLTAVRKKCVSVFVDGCGLAPPTVVDAAWSAASEITTGAGELAALTDDANNGIVMAALAARQSLRARGRNTSFSFERWPRNDPASKLSRCEGRRSYLLISLLTPHGPAPVRGKPLRLAT